MYIYATIKYALFSLFLHFYTYILPAKIHSIQFRYLFVNPAFLPEHSGAVSLICSGILYEYIHVYRNRTLLIHTNTKALPYYKYSSALLFLF